MKINYVYIYIYIYNYINIKVQKYTVYNYKKDIKV